MVERTTKRFSIMVNDGVYNADTPEELLRMAKLDCYTVPATVSEYMTDIEMRAEAMGITLDASDPLQLLKDLDRAGIIIFCDEEAQ